MSSRLWKRLRCLVTGHRLGVYANPAGVCIDCGAETQKPEHQPDGVHTIPVPRGWTPEQAWEAIRRGDLLTDPEPEWANVLIERGKFVKLYTIETP